MSRRVIPSGSSEAPSGNSRSQSSTEFGPVLEVRSPVARTFRSTISGPRPSGPPSPRLRRYVNPAHRWHPEQSVGGWTGLPLELRHECRRVPGGVHFMLVTSETGRRLGPGLRWQSRHQLMLRGLACVTVSISSMRPWQVTQPIPAATWTLCAK